MSSRVYGLMPLATDEPISFYKVHGGRFELAGASDVDGAKDITVLVPGTEIGFHSVRLPVRTEGEARRAAPFAIEDALAVPAEDVHIALGRANGETGEREILVCGRDIMDAWIERLSRTKSLREARLVADLSIIPSGEQVLALPDRTLASIKGQRFAVDARLPSDVLQAVLQDDTRHVQPTTDPIQTLLGWADQADNLVDLRQGTYAARRSSDIDWSNWRLPAGIAAACAVAWIGALSMENRALDDLTSQMSSASRAMYSAANPGEQVPRNLIQAIRSGAQQERALDFREASALLYDGIADVEGAGIQSLRFDRSGGIMRARISYPNFGDELKLKAHLEEAGISVRTGDMRQQGGRVSGEIAMELTQ